MTSNDRSASTLFHPYAVGQIPLENRIVMAPMTRSRAVSNAPDASTVTYYQQRASAGLIITEGTVVSAQGRGYLWTPGIYSTEQIAGWREVTKAVHKAGGKIFLQLWHVGRMSHVTLQDDHRAPVSSVESQIKGAKVFAYDESGKPAQLPASAARALTREEIHQITRDFADAAVNAISAGFDGVELHAANGYLFEQFINGGLNTRDDEYGGTAIEDRLRFLIETLDAICHAVGSAKVGVRLSPYSGQLDMPSYSDERETYLALVRELEQRGIAYLHLNSSKESGQIEAEIRDLFSGPLMLCGQYTFERAQQALDENRADLIAFGRPFIANPDLVQRLRNNWPLTEAKKADYYGGGNAGYIDFPSYPDSVPR